MIRIAEIEESFKEIFNDDVVASIETIYEKPDNEEDFLKLIISIHGLSTDDVTVIHTKFIFKVDSGKHTLIDNTLLYLYDINCVYHKVDFENIIDMKTKIEDIIESGNFGKSLIILSDFIESPAMFLNYYMKREKITEYSVFDVVYEPKLKIQKCSDTKFDFKININNNYDMELTIWKVEAIEEDEIDIFKFQFKFMDEIETFETDSLKNIHYFIGSNIAKMLDQKLKNKE